jgi:hypothetical protein
MRIVRIILALALHSGPFGWPREKPTTMRLGR